MEKNYDKAYLEQLAHKMQTAALTQEEQMYFDTWFHAMAAQPLEIPEEYASSESEVHDRLYRHLYATMNPGHTQTSGLSSLFNRRWLMAAASIMLVSVFGIYIYNMQQQPPARVVISEKTDIAPGSNKAVLTFANGKQINLTDVAIGNIAENNGMRISKTADGVLQYTPTALKPMAAGTNSIATPAGGQYTVQLPDGTRVMLNAASSLTYPEQFDNAERKVTLTGEAYFEVAAESKRPFRVQTANQLVEVLGTRFNLNCYEDEPVTTTILEDGSVNVTSAAEKKTLRPGQQSTLKKGDMAFTISDADLQTGLAWTRGKLTFKDADLPTILRLVSRWYNVQIRYEGVIKDDLYTGGISRNSKLSTLLDILKDNSIHFHLETNQGEQILVVKP